MSRRKVKVSGQRRRRAADPSVRDEFEATVRDLSSDGRGVAEAPDGQVVFISGVWVGERITLERTRRGATVSCQLLHVSEPHAERVTPPCRYHASSECGGCPWMFAGYEAQLQAKQTRLVSAAQQLTRRGSPLHSLPTLLMYPAEQKLAYRNRAQFKSDGERLGYLASGSHQIADIEECLVLTPVNQVQLKQLRETLPRDDWKPRARQKWVTIDIDDARADPLVNQRQPFRQANSRQNDRLITWLSETLAGLPNADVIVELFCGSGNLTETLTSAMRTAEIVAVEGDMTALEALELRGLDRVHTRQANLFSPESVRTLVGDLPSVSGLVLDPPREGLKERAALQPLFTQAQWVIYISCNVATWQRDAQSLLDAGLELSALAGLDMFPQTPHLEILSVFTRRD